MTETAAPATSVAPALAPAPASVTVVQGVGYLRRVIASVLTAIVVSFVAYAVNVLMLFAANGASWAALVSLSNYFTLSALVIFVVLFIGALLTAFTRWYWALVCGLVAGAAGAVLGSVLMVSGTTLTAELWGTIFATLGGVNLILWVAVVVTAVTLGRTVYAAVLGRTGGAAVRRVALVRLPSANLAEALTTRTGGAPVDAERADEQWDAYVAALVEAGWSPVEVAPADDLADSVFVEDTAIVLGDTAVIMSPGAESRRGELEGVERKLREYALRIAHIQQPGTLDGGDVLQVGATIYVGRGARTNAEGIRQLRAIAAPLGYTVVAVPVTKALHLTSAATALPDGTVVGNPEVIGDPGVFGRFLAVPEPSGAQLVVLDHDTVLIAASAPESAALIEDLGYRVVRLDVSEFEKLDGGVRCLSVRLE